MISAICIVGLPGSGKTYYANLISNNKIPILDDITSLENLPNSDVIITDPYFCYTHIREKAERILLKKYDEVEWIFFENDKNKCINNVNYRNDGRKVQGLIHILHKEYKIPDRYIPYTKTIWQPT